MNFLLVGIMRWSFNGFSENSNNISKLINIISYNFLELFAEVFPQYRSIVYKTTWWNSLKNCGEISLKLLEIHLKVLWNYFKYWMKFSFKILWKSLKNFMEIAQKFRKIFFKVTLNSPEIRINSVKNWMKFFVRNFLKNWWCFSKNFVKFPEKKKKKKTVKFSLKSSEILLKNCVNFS